MAAHPILIVDDGILERLPESFRGDPRYQRGASVELMPVAEITKTKARPYVIRSWRDLRGILADSPFDPNAALEAEKQRELKSEGR